MNEQVVVEPSIIHCPVKEMAPLPSYDLAEVEPLVAHLQQDVAASSEIVFPRGTITPDGRLDLCKQSLGVAGCTMVTQALKSNSQVKALLLGTDGIGDEGAARVGELIGANPNLEIIYLGCNRIGAAGAQIIAQTLEQNTSVRGLWLKRNPLGAQGAKAIAAMLRQNTTLRTLDLVNTQIGEEGFAALIDVLRNGNRTLQRLYLGACGITARGARQLADALRENPVLTALLLNVNHIGDDGAKEFAAALSENETLEELGLASNGIGSEGTIALLEAAARHPRLRVLDLGYSRSTKVLNAKANQLRDEDAAHIGTLLSNNPTLRQLDLRGTGLNEAAQETLIDKLEDNRSLCELWLPGKQADRLKELLQRNRALQNPIVTAPDVALIKSVYR